MAKERLIEVISALKPAWTLKECEEALDLVLDAIPIATAGAENQRLTLRGFGAFRIHRNAARSGTTPTGKDWIKEENRTLKFSAAPALDERITRSTGIEEDIGMI